MPQQKIYLIGICGTAMGALAGMLQDSGHRVLGSDQGVYPPISTFLARKGIPVLAGFKAEHIDAARPDLVIIGNVVRRENPEARRVMELGLDYLSLPQALGRYFLAGRQSLVAAGTHGKTTTAALLAWLLEAAGADPSFLVGGICRNFGSNYKLGNGPQFVIEGDEYDTAYFDKVPKFVHYRPLWTILSSVEFDHADIYADFEAVKAAFARLVELIPTQGRLLVFESDREARALAQLSSCPVLLYGFGPEAILRAEAVELGPERVGFNLIRDGRDLGRFRSPLPGRHNLANTLAALGLLLEMGFEAGRLAEGLVRFQGVKRRQEIIANISDVLVMDDFAHHPTAVRETLLALKSFYPGRRLVAVFEPRTNTSRRRFFQADYAASFQGADLVLLREPPGVEAVPPEERFSSAKLAADLRAAGQAAQSFPETDSLLASLLEAAGPGDLIAVMSNGGFDGLYTRLVEGLGRKFGP